MMVMVVMVMEMEMEMVMYLVTWSPLMLAKIMKKKLQVVYIILYGSCCGHICVFGREEGGGVSHCNLLIVNPSFDRA